MPQNRKLSDLEAATLVSKQYRYQCFHITFSSTSNLADSDEYGSAFTWFTGKAHFRQKFKCSHDLNIKFII